MLLLETIAYTMTPHTGFITTLLPVKILSISETTGGTPPAVPIWMPKHTTGMTMHPRDL